MRKYMSWSELTQTFREHEKNSPKKPLYGAALITSDSFDKEYSEEGRTYCFNSHNKAFMPNMGGYSIFASALDGSDTGVRLEAYLAVEKGGKDGWKIEKCWIETEE